MKKSYRNVLVVLFTIFTLMICFFVLFKMEAMNVYYSHKYEKEISSLRKIVSSIAKNNYNDIKKQSTADSTMLRPGVFAKIQEILKGVNISDLSIRRLTKKETAETEEIFADFYFKSSTDLNFRTKLVNSSGQWLLESLYILE